MKALLAGVCLLLCSAGAGAVAPAPADTCNHRLYYTSPASIWEETLPLGNGRLGMMPDGGIGQEHIVLNEISLWSGSESDYGNPLAADSLPAIRQLLIEGRNREAQELMYRSFVPKKQETDGRYGTYQVLAGLELLFSYDHAGLKEDTILPSQVSGYERSLSLRDAVASTSFSLAGVNYRREYFVSRNLDVMLIHLTADKPGTLSFMAFLDRQERGRTSISGKTHVLTGRLDSGNPSQPGMAYRVGLRMVANEGAVMRSVSNSGVALAGGQEAWLIVSATTSFEAEGTDDQKTNFYTAFYHALIQPNNIADVDGAYRDANGKLARADNGQYYSTFSTWDTYRAAHPLYTLAVPEKVSPFVRSMIAHADACGYLPVWTLWGKENYCMIGNHSVAIIAEAYHKGFRDYDADRAFEAIKRTQTVAHGPKSHWDVYMKHGYFPADLIRTESVSSTLESVYDDYAAADMARLMGRKDDAEYFTRRAGFYRNLFDPSTGFMRPRNSDGSWKSPFNPSLLAHAESTGGDYTEGNAWQYTWHVQHDIPGLIKLMGGPKAMTRKLDSLFTVRLESTLADVTGLIGQYAHGNEPSHHVAYLYALAGRPERTQELVRQIFDTQYLPKPDGLCGNDDCGQMSAWYLLSAMGFYPVDPVSARYVFGAPQLPRIVLHLPDGKRFTVVAEGLDREHLYVDRIYLNGKRYRKNYIEHADIVKGGTLVFRMRR